ncbi:MAG: mucoidy inhibitor MuiA family protein [Archangium sp.]|nr:mucoidy inhibitor MuiA family protein [Archangium sp.]MDP3569363.1 mucoidy inhibitor MuiA family protein [Archangium sp.]
MNALVLTILASTAGPDSVVVFPDRAQVTRVTTLTCGARVPVSFENIPPIATQDSFRARVTGGAVDGMRAELVKNEKEFSPKAEALVKSLEALQLEIENTTDQMSRAQTQTKVGRQYTDIAVTLVSREMAAEKPDLKNWQSAFDSSLGASLSAAKLTSEINAKLRQLRLKEEELRRQLDEVRLEQNRQSWTVEVLASCPAGKTAELALTYLVGGASWTPVYEARADESGGAVDFSTWATIVQRTGEDWSQVELTLSTAVPSQNATPPDLKVLKVSAYEKAVEKKVLVRRDEYVEQAQTGSGGETESTGQAVAKSQGLSVQLRVPEKSKVPGDNAPVRLFVGLTKMKASFELRAMPKLMPVAFRVAELTNTAAWPLLAGRVDAFRSTGMVGRYALERVPQGGAFSLTFGVEEAVRVKRTIVDELKRDTGLFNGNKRFTYAYAFEVANYGKTPIEVALAEHLPVSEMNDIIVAVGEKTTAGYQLNPKDGIAKWKVSLKAGEKKKVDFAFRVDVPSSYETGGL